MNIYCLVEGKVTEKQVYASWIPMINPMLRVVDFVQHATQNHVYIVSGEGMPQIFSRIAPSVQDMNAFPVFDRFVVSVDSEEMTEAAKLNELMTHVAAAGPPVPTYAIVQHYCFETWALGNRKMAKKLPGLPRLAAFKKHFDVGSNDPALMPSMNPTAMSRAEFSQSYLRLLLNNQHRNLSYSKSNPAAVCHPKYFAQVRSRLVDTGHIASLQQFVSAFT